MQICISNMTLRFLSLTLSIFILGSFMGFAQETDAPQATTASDPYISKDILSLSLDPLTKDELAVEAKAWRDVLEEKAKEITRAEISIIRKEVDVKATRARISNLTKQKASIIARTRIALAAYELKGGDVAEYNTYVAAVTGIDAGANDIATRWNGVTTWLQSEEGGLKWLVNGLKFIAVMIAFLFISRFAARLIHNALEKQEHISSLLKVFINKMSRRFILLIGLIVALGTMGVNVGAALALIGGGAFILAFALQDTLGNFAAGLMLIVYRPFDVGNAVEVGGVTGSVDSVSLVSTVIRTPDNKKVIVPNKKVWGEVITNITGMPTRRVDMIFGIGYDDDIEKAQEILERIVAENELILEEPAPVIRLHELGDSSVNFVCRPWAIASNHWPVHWAVTKRVKEEFDAAGISIPFPQSDVHLHLPEGTELPAPKPSDS